MLPGMLGQDILRRAKSDPATSGVHFVVMSAWPQSLTEADRRLIDATFPKPFDVDRVLQTVDSLSQ